MTSRWTESFVIMSFLARKHGVWKSQKRSHSTLRAKRATFTFWLDKSWLKRPKWSILARFWKPEACGQTVLPDKSILKGQKLAENAKIQKCDIRHRIKSKENATYCVIFKQCAKLQISRPKKNPFRENNFQLLCESQDLNSLMIIWLSSARWTLRLTAKVVSSAASILKRKKKWEKFYQIIPILKTTIRQ